MATQHDEEDKLGNTIQNDHESESSESEDEVDQSHHKSALKKSEPAMPTPTKPFLPGQPFLVHSHPPKVLTSETEQPDPSTLDVTTLTPLTPEIIARQGTPYSHLSALSLL